MSNNSFNDAHKAILPLVALPCAAIFFVFYRFGKRSLPEGKTQEQHRLIYLYPFIAAQLLGEFFFQAQGNTPFVMVGFFIMLCIEKLSRVWHENPYYMAAEGNSMEIRHAINLQTMEEVEYFHAENLDESSADDKASLVDETSELSRRRRICLLTFVVMVILAMLEGFYILYSTWNPWIVTFIFILDKLMETTILSVSMLHAYMHTPTERSRNRYAYLALTWCVVCACSTIPVCANMTQLEATHVIRHTATMIFYQLAGGFLFWVALYYIWITQRKTDKKETIIQLIVFAVSSAISWTVGFFY